MVIPSFSGFAATPNLAEAYLGGQRVSLERQRIQQSAQQAAAELQVQRERMAQQAQFQEMELAAKEKVVEQENLRKQTELATEAAYKQASLGLRQAELEAQVAQQVAQRLQHREDQSQQLELGVQGLNERARHNAAMESTASARIGASGDFGAAEDVPGLEGYKRVRTGPTTAQYLKAGGPAIPSNLNVTAGQVLDASGAPIPGKFTVAGPDGRPRVYSSPLPRIPPEIKEAKEEIKQMEALYPFLANGGEPNSRGMREKAPALRKKYEDLKSQVRGSRGPALPTSVTTNALPRIRAIYQNQ